MGCFWTSAHHFSGVGNYCSQIESVSGPLPRWLVAELRSDHAGETGAVAIYKGILAVSSDPEVRRFAVAHLSTEEAHLAHFDRLLSSDQRSMLLPLWRLAGFVTGALPALFGANATFATIEAVETFVDGHYQQQIDRLRNDPTLALISSLLEECRQDEVDHRDDAAGRCHRDQPLLLRCWIRMIGVGSAAAVALARRG